VPVKRVLASAWRHLRHPTRRGALRAAAAVPVLFLLYVLALIPFTPGIGDIRKARRSARAGAVRRRQGARGIQAGEPRMGVAQADLAAHGRRADRDRGPSLLRAPRPRLEAHRVGGAHTFSGDRQGGSTITQQLARNLYPDEIGRAPTLTRKEGSDHRAEDRGRVQQGEILETYLNTVPFLYNAYGVEMAARTYFDKSADELDVLDAATLVGMLKGNSYYNPVLNPSARCSGATRCSRRW
jgi:penicillin-binding protein 1A